MADHLIERELTYVLVRCGNGRCQETWQQLSHATDNAGDWNVCPHCLWAAPTNVSRALRDSDLTKET